MKAPLQRFKESIRPARYTSQPKFEDKVLKHGLKFEHSWTNLAHMHDLRVWYVAYAPGRLYNIQRLQELHHLNNEMWYQISNALWKRTLIAMFIFFWTTRISKDKYCKK